MTLEQEIREADETSQRLQALLVDKSVTTRSFRDPVCLHHWSLLFELHQGILVLFQSKLCSRAFALMRPMTESFCRLFVVIHGTEAQVSSIVAGTYCTDFEAILTQMDSTLFREPLFATWLNKDRLGVLHGFTHGGVEQLSRHYDGDGVVANYSDQDIRGVMVFTGLLAFLTTLLVAEFLGFAPEFKQAQEMFGVFISKSLIADI